MEATLRFQSDDEADTWREVVIAAVRAGHGVHTAMTTADDAVMGLRARQTT